MIVSAATRYLMDGRDMITLPVHRHKDADVIMRALPLADDGHEWIKVEEGFLTEEYEFLDRRSAVEHAYVYGQLDWMPEWDKESTLVSECLMSEDLW